MIRRQSVENVNIEGSQAVEGAARDAALADFVGDHYERLLRLARLVCRDAPDAADAVQIGLEQAWRRRSSLRDDARLRPWLDRIIVREAIRLSTSRRPWLRRLFNPDPDAAWIEPLDARSAQLHVWTALRIAFGQLSSEQRAVIALHLHAGYSVAETADLVGVPIETVRSRLRLAKERLRNKLEEADR